MMRRRPDLPVGTGMSGDLPYDRSGLEGLMPAADPSAGMQGEAQPPVAAEPGGMPRMDTSQLSNQDLMGMQGEGVGPVDMSPDEVMGDQLSEAYNDPNLDPEHRAQLEEQMRRAALSMLGLGG